MDLLHFTMASKVFALKLCLFCHVIEVVFGISLATLSFLLQKTADVDLKATPSWAGIPFAILGLAGIIIIVLKKHKDELVFVLVLHGLVVVLCFVGLLLVAPRVHRWKNVDKYQIDGECNQLASRCNCTKTLPTKVYKCTDLPHIYTLAVVTAVFAAVCFVTACISAFLDFYVIKTCSTLKDEPLTNIKKDNSEKAEESQYDGMGHIGPLSTPDLLPKHEHEITPREDSLEWNRRKNNKQNEKRSAVVTEEDRLSSPILSDYGQQSDEDELTGYDDIENSETPKSVRSNVYIAATDNADTDNADTDNAGALNAVTINAKGSNSNSSKVINPNVSRSDADNTGAVKAKSDKANEHLQRSDVSNTGTVHSDAENAKSKGINATLHRSKTTNAHQATAQTANVYSPKARVKNASAHGYDAINARALHSHFANAHAVDSKATKARDINTSARDINTSARDINTSARDINTSPRIDAINAAAIHADTFRPTFVNAKSISSIKGSVHTEEDGVYFSETELKWQESPRNNQRNSITSAVSLPMGNGVAGVRPRPNPIRERAVSMPDSVAGSKQSIRSRKDHLLRRLQAVQAQENEQPHSGNENEEIILNAIQNSSQSSLRKTSPQTASALTPTRFSPQRNSPRQELPESPTTNNEDDDVLNRVESPNNSQRSSSQRNINVGNVHENGTTEQVEDIVRGSRPKTGRTRLNLNLNGISNEETFGLPPLPLKGSQTGLSVAERTFSAPALPFIEPTTDISLGPNLGQRPGSSGSQVVARSKREHNAHVRNDLIDKDMLSEDDFLDRRTTGRFNKARGSVSDDGSIYQMRKTSYETTSTDVGIIDDGKTVTSESTEDLSKKPRWHPPWQLKQEIVAHRDSVPVIAIEPKNRWFASGSSDRSMKIWDINTGACRLTVRDHKAGIRALTFGITGHRFLFSAGDDRQLLCTDIEVNRVIHKYPDQSSVIYAMTIYAPSELLITCGRDKYVKIWDTREQKCVKTMRGHINTVSSLAVLEGSRQIISGSHDSTMRMWDIGEGRCTQILMGHEKSVRSIVVHPEDPIISSASTERIIHWSMPEGVKMKEITPTDISINCISVNPQGALVAAGSNGVIHLWDWKTGHKFQKIHRTKVYESQEVPICVFCVSFDKSGSRLIVSDASNVIKVYREAYTRVRRRHNLSEEKNSKKKGTMFSKIPTPEYAFM